MLVALIISLKALCVIHTCACFASCSYIHRAQSLSLTANAAGRPLCLRCQPRSRSRRRSSKPGRCYHCQPKLPGVNFSCCCAKSEGTRLQASSLPLPRFILRCQLRFRSTLVNTASPSTQPGQPRRFGSPDQSRRLRNAFLDPAPSCMYPCTIIRRASIKWDLAEGYRHTLCM